MGYLWPAYSCYKALDQRKTEVLREWCIYWFACLPWATSLVPHEASLLLPAMDWRSS